MMPTLFIINVMFMFIKKGYSLPCCFYYYHSRAGR